MSYDLTKSVFPTSLVQVNTESEMERYTNDREARDIRREGMRHLVAKRVHATKTTTAISLTTQVHQHAITTADRFIQDATTRLQATGRTPEAQAYMESFTQGMLGMYQEHIGGIVQVGVMNIAREASRDVVLPKEEKRGWFR